MVYSLKELKHKFYLSDHDIEIIVMYGSGLVFRLSPKTVLGFRRPYELRFLRQI